MPSLHNFLTFLAFWPASWVLINTTQDHIETVLGIYLAAFVLNSIGGKLGDAYSNHLQQKDMNDAPRP